MKNPFFIEAGSQDAEKNSNTIHFEVSHGWSGLLVEAHPVFFDQGLTRHRNVTSVNTWLGLSSRPEDMEFDHNAAATGEVRSMAGLVQQTTDTSVRMQCLPLASLVLAMGNPTVHYFR